MGERTTFQGLIDILGEIEGCKYESKYLPVEQALAEQEKAWKAEDEEGEIYWSLRTLGASGDALVPGPLDNGRFDFQPESVRQTFERTFRKR